MKYIYVVAKKWPEMVVKWATHTVVAFICTQSIVANWARSKLTRQNVNDLKNNYLQCKWNQPLFFFSNFKIIYLLNFFKKKYGMYYKTMFRLFLIRWLHNIWQLKTKWKVWLDVSESLNTYEVASFWVDSFLVTLLDR